MSDTIAPETIEKAKNGDSFAVEEIISRFQKPLYFYALHYLGNSFEAEDLTQDVLIKAVKALPTFKGYSSLGTWIFKIMTNACIDFRRKRVLPAISFNDSGIDNQPYLIEPVDPLPLPDESYVRQELKTIIQCALSRLSEEHRMVIILHDLHGFKYHEIAEITKTGLGTVKSRLFYARQELRKILGPSLERGDI